MDGDEVSNATMCPTPQCTTCWCLQSVFLIRTLCIRLETQDIRERVAEERKKLLQRDGQPLDAAKKRYVDTGISMSYERYTTDIEKEYPKIITGISKNYEWTKNYE
jgi:hypothetical protein